MSSNTPGSDYFRTGGAAADLENCVKSAPVTLRPLLVFRLGACLVLGGISIAIAIVTVVDWVGAGSLVFTLFFLGLAFACYRGATAVIRVEDEQVSFRGLLPTTTISLGSINGWEQTDFNGSILWSLRLTDGSKYRIPMALQGGKRQVGRLKLELQRLGVAPSPPDEDPADLSAP